jgi:hypothetical protein
VRQLTRYAACLTVLLAGLVLVPGCSADKAVTSEKDTALAARIEQLVETFFMSGEAAAETKVRTEALEIFEREGIPSQVKVGDAAAYGFVLLNVVAQKSDIRLKFLERMNDPKIRDGLPADAIAFADARRRQLEIEERFKTREPTAPELRDQITRLLKDDQAVRQRGNFDLEKMAAADRQTAGPLKAILDKYGVPTFDMVGVPAARDFVVLVQHQAPEVRAEVLPKLKANVDAGQADPESYTLVYDRTQHDQGRKQLYGQNLICTDAKVLDVGPMDDPANVNMRRAEMGLMRLELYKQLVRLNSPDCGAFGGHK